MRRVYAWTVRTTEAIRAMAPTKATTANATASFGLNVMITHLLLIRKNIDKHGTIAQIVPLSRSSFATGWFFMREYFMGGVSLAH